MQQLNFVLHDSTVRAGDCAFNTTYATGYVSMANVTLDLVYQTNYNVAVWAMWEGNGSTLAPPSVTNKWRNVTGIFDYNNWTNPAEAVGCFAANAVNDVDNFVPVVINTNNLAYGRLPEAILTESSPLVAVGARQPLSGFTFYNPNGSSGGTNLFPSMKNTYGDWSKLDFSDINLLTNGPVQVVSNGMWAFPGCGQASVYFCANGTQAAAVNDFSNFIVHYPYGVTFTLVNSNATGIGGGTNLMFTNAQTGISFGVAAANGMQITNYGNGPNALQTSNANDSMVFTFFGTGVDAIQICGQSVNAGVPGNNWKQWNNVATLLTPAGFNLTNLAITFTGGASPMEGIVENGSYVSFSPIPVNGQRMMFTNIWLASIPMGSHGISYTIGTAGVTGNFSTTNNGNGTNWSFVNGVLIGHSP
jgi:hypothetical protein